MPNPFLYISRVRFQTVQFSIVFLFTHSYMSKTVLFETIQFSISTQFNSIRTIHRTQSGVITTEQSGPGNDSNEGDCRIHRLQLCKDSPNECPRYDTKQSDGEVPVM